MENTTSTLASSNGSATPSKTRSSTSGRVSYSESPTSTPIQCTLGSAALKASTESPRPQPRSTTRAFGEHKGRDQALRERLRGRRRRNRRPQHRSEIGTRQAAIGHRGQYYERAVVLRVVLGRTRRLTREPWAWERRRALLLAEVRPGERVLDLGCGAGGFLAVLRDAGAEPVGVDIAEAAVERARTNVPGADVRLLEGDGVIPAGHGEFELVWCSEVLEHIPDVAEALYEVRRVLKPGGRLLLTVPHDEPVRGRCCASSEHFDPLGQHVRFFTRRSLARTLEATGFAPCGGQPRGRDARGARYRAR